MYYKITDKESQIYKELYEMRVVEKQLDANNLKLVEDKIGSDWSGFLGHVGQQTFNRSTVYKGFKFNNPKKVDLKVWRFDKDSECFIPNKRTKKGKEISDFLKKLPVNGWYDTVLTKLNITVKLSRFKFPFVEICGDVIIIYLDDNHIPLDENVVEITSKEFNEFNKNLNK